MSTWKERMQGGAPRPPAKLIEVCWRMYGPSDHAFECSLFEAPDGVEVRIHYGTDAVVRSELVHHVEAGRMLAGAWRSGALSAGFQDVPPGQV